MLRRDYRYAERADVLLPLFEKINSEDELAEGKMKRGSSFTIGAGVAFFISMFVAGFIHPALFILTGLLFLCMVGGGLYWFRNQRHDLDDRKVGTCLRLLRVLRADVPATQKLSVHVDLRDYQKGGTVLESSKTGGVRFFRYEHTWLETRARLSDGSAVVLAITDRVRRKEKPKRKYTKVAEHTLSRVTVAVRLGRRYGDAAAVAERLRQRPLQERFELRQVVARGRVVKASFVTPVAASFTNRTGTQQSGAEALGSGDTLLLALRWIYGGLAATPRAA